MTHCVTKRGWKRSATLPSFDAVAFDLDGTLADTLTDLTLSMNHGLAVLGRPPLTPDDVRRHVGDGVRAFCRRALGAEGADEALVEALLGHYRPHYVAHQFDHTALYPGIPELLVTLAGRGLRMAVLSNKPDDSTRSMVAQLCPPGLFDVVMGHREGVPAKPDPEPARRLAEALHVPLGRIAFVGDSGVDMETARRSGMHGIGVLWGFRGADELRAAGARALVRHPGELPALLG